MTYNDEASDIFAYQLFGTRWYCYPSSAKPETKTPVIKKCILIIPEPILEGLEVLLL